MTSRVVWKYAGPLTLVWGGLCADFGALAEGWIDLKWAIAYAGLLLITVGLLFILREVVLIHQLTNSHNDAQEARIAQLIDALQAGGKPVPDAPTARKAAS